MLRRGQTYSSGLEDGRQQVSAMFGTAQRRPVQSAVLHTAGCSRNTEPASRAFAAQRDEVSQLDGGFHIFEHRAVAAEVGYATRSKKRGFSRPCPQRLAVRVIGKRLATLPIFFTNPFELVAQRLRRTGNGLVYSP